MNKLLFLSFLCITLIQSKIMEIFNDRKLQNQSKDEDKGNYSKMTENVEAVNPAGKVKGWMKKLSNRGGNGNFKGWMKKHRRNYRPQEQNLRFQVFNRNQILVEDHNNAGNSKFSMGLNKFADLTDQQFQQMYLSKIIPQFKISSIAPPPFSEDNDSSTRLLQSTGIDWRDYIKFAPIKDQGLCAACYAFADIGALELNWALKHGGVQPSLSEQQIIDCCGTAGYKCTGCVSGGLGMTYEFLAKYGVQTSERYPYAGLAQNCSLSGLSGKNYLRQDRPYYQSSGIRNTINYLTRGPVSVAADATNWKFYTSGTFDSCPRYYFNYTHACIIIGINLDGSWIIRNSWGADWGMQGYITLQAGNTCGITNYVYFPLAS